MKILGLAKPLLNRKRSKIEPLKKISEDEYKYSFSVTAQNLILNEFESNGCGWVGVNRWIAVLLTHLFSFDLREPCHIHDAEWSIPLDQKSPRHRMQSDNNLEANLAIKIEEYRNHPEKLSPFRRKLYESSAIYRRAYSWSIDNLPQKYHAVVTAIGKKHYWHHS